MEEPIKKTRGRKKKVQTENLDENINEKKAKNKKSLNETNELNELDESNKLDNNEEEDENLKIEQVKKKRGRKKKWEVETTTKLIENAPISFNQNQNKEETKEIDDNYEAENILFGNLNIKVHTNKEVVPVDSIKNTLVSNKTSNNNNTECKINLTLSDFEDSDISDDETEKKKSNSKISRKSNSDMCKISHLVSKKKIIERNMKVMKYYIDEYDKGNEILISKIRCYNCHHNFNNKPFFLPIDYNSELGRFKVTGNFCSPNCVKSYAINSKIHSHKVYLIAHMYRKLYGASYTIKPAPPIQCLKEYGGKLTIEEFRANFDNNTKYVLKNICSKVITDEIITT